MLETKCVDTFEMSVTDFLTLKTTYSRTTRTKLMRSSFRDLWDFDIITLEFKLNQVYVFRLIFKIFFRDFLIGISTKYQPQIVLLFVSSSDDLSGYKNFFYQSNFTIL